MAFGFGPDPWHKILGHRASARRDGDILPSVEGIADGRRCDAAAGVEGPNFFSRARIERKRVALQVASKNQITSRCEERGKVEIFRLKRPLPLSRERIECADMRRAFRVRYLEHRATHELIAFFHLHFVRLEMCADFEAGGVPQARARAIRGVIETSSSVGAGAEQKI